MAKSNSRVQKRCKKIISRAYREKNGKNQQKVNLYKKRKGK